MTTFAQGNFYAAVAGADLTGKQGYIVKTDASGNFVLATSATDAIFGVLEHECKVGDTASAATVNGTGTYKVVAGAAIAKDALLTADSTGRAVATTTTGNRVFGRALTVATQAGDVIEYVRMNESY